MEMMVKQKSNQSMEGGGVVAHIGMVHAASAPGTRSVLQKSMR